MGNMKKTIAAVAAFAATLVVVLLVRAHFSDPVQKRTRFIMDTYCTIQAPGGSEVIPAINRALDRMTELDNKFSIFNKKSPVYAFNEYNTPITDPEIVKITKDMIYAAEKSEGLLDLTIVPLEEVWGFYTGGTPHLPRPEEIKEAMKKVNYRNIIIKEGKVTKKYPWVKIDFGTIAKGYAVEEAGIVLINNGIKSALIDGGGNIEAIGRYKGKPWKVGIKNPRGEGVIGVLDAENLAITTAGDYERYFEKDGVIYHHIMDPYTGYPGKKMISVTVVSPSSLTADTWDTALFLLGKEKALKLASELNGVECILVTPDGKITYSKGLEKYLKQDYK
jgi:thiamine biosynthesis lipoprotein